MLSYILGGALTIVTGGGITAIVMLIRALRTAQKDADAMEDKLSLEMRARFQADLSLRDVIANRNALKTALDDKEKELAREQEARKVAERHRKELLDYLAKVGDPAGAATRVVHELELLSNLSTPSGSGTRRQGP